MWPYHPELLATPVPRYTSYPTAAEFHEGIGSAEQREGLAGVESDEPISLYVHIPYCREICWYCGCNTGAANRSSRLANYLGALDREITLVARHLAGRGRIVRIAFGGGSPNAIAADQMRGLAQSLRAQFRIEDDAVWSVEVDPRGFDQSFAEVLAEIGVQRASLGVQTFDPAIQQQIGRVQPKAVIASTVAMLRDAGVDSLNFDLMYGLPGQDVGALLASIDTSIQLGADRLAVFGYAHVPHLVPRQRRIDARALPDAEARFETASAAHNSIVSRGWASIGFDHYARPGDPLAVAAAHGTIRRNFQGYTDDPCDTLIGLGASSISRFPNGLVQNEKNAGRYGLLVGNRMLAGTRGIATPPEERRRARVIERLLCQGAVDLASLPDMADIQRQLTPFEQRGLVAWDGTRLTVAAHGQAYARTIAASLDPWRRSSEKRFSSAV